MSDSPLPPLCENETDIAEGNESEFDQDIVQAMANFASSKPPPAAFRAFKKCKSATFALDGTLYTIGMFFNFLQVQYPIILISSIIYNGILFSC